MDIPDYIEEDLERIITNCDYEFSKLNHMLSINTKKILDGKFNVFYKNND